MTEQELDEVRAFLGAHHTLTLATLGSDGAPQAADLYYVMLDDLKIGFISTPSSRHVANVSRDHHVACTIHASATGPAKSARNCSPAESARDCSWHDIRGIQMEGTCSRLSAVQEARAWPRYIARFPFVMADAVLRAALQRVNIYCITPHWLRWIDNSISLGHQVEYRL
jgi:uncharacterized protein YhbP (UPF0306 family)